MTYGFVLWFLCSDSFVAYTALRKLCRSKLPAGNYNEAQGAQERACKINLMASGGR